VSKTAVIDRGAGQASTPVQNVIRALPRVVLEFPDVVHIILGATHPNLIRQQGETYRLSLERLAAELEVKKHVISYNRFVELEELQEFLGAADIYITPYIHAAQITSGTLAYAFGCGKAVMSTPYWHAQELLAEGRGILVPFGDNKAIAGKLIAFISERRRFHNFMSFDRRWLDDDGSDDCFARALLALGACIGRSRREDLRRWAVELFNHALPTIEEAISPAPGH
jgi:glycosyltransferase involved in cell wall biosynthesis